MTNSSKQNPTLSNTAEIVKNIGWGKNTPLQWRIMGVPKLIGSHLNIKTQIIPSVG
jgi:hypothetical protein